MSLPRKELRFPKTLLEPMRHAIEARDLGVTLQDMLEHLGIDRARFDDPGFSIDGDAFIALHRWLKARTQGRIRLKDWLSGYSATSIGLTGLAALSSLSGRDALNVCIRYMPLVAPALKVTLFEGPQTSRLVLEVVADLEEMNRVLLELTAGIINIISHETMGAGIPRTIHFRHDCGVDSQGNSRLDEYREAYCCEVVFNSSFDGFVAESKYLDTRTRSPNEATSRLTRSILDSEIEARMASQSFASFVRNELLQMAKAGKFPSVEEFADRIHLTPRTLSRRLEKEQTTYKSLANEAWFTLARDLLTGTQLTVDQVAHRTGFTNGNSFSRAFKSLAGIPPLQWKREQAARK
jgi:AraC-like DNA-binding protein